MDPIMSTQERQLCHFLMDLPRCHRYRYTEQASRQLLQTLFLSLAGRKEYMNLFFPYGTPPTSEAWKLRDAQGALDGAEYTEGARGKACGHIFKAGEAIYTCRTCSTDDTCVLCSRCFDATDHTGHMLRISISPGNSGCCDCGDPEAWKLPLFCTIHSERNGQPGAEPKQKERGLPDDLISSVRMTVARVLDYICDVISCSPEQLRQQKTVESVEMDEKLSRLSSPYTHDDEDPSGDYALILWNDEKHTIEDVKNQVARACRVREQEGLTRARETDTIGRSILKYDSDIHTLLRMATILEQIKVTVTIRSSRDTFREQMCSTMVDWLSDISGCRVGNDLHILRTVVCEEMLRPWQQGSLATHALVGKDGIDDEAKRSEDADNEGVAITGAVIGETIVVQQIRAMIQQRDRLRMGGFGFESDDEEMSEGGEETPSSGEMDEDDDIDQVAWDNQGEGSGDVRMSDWNGGTNDQALEEDEATLAGYPPPPPPPAAGVRRHIRDRDVTPSDSDTAEPFIAPTHITKGPDIPKTPGTPKARNPQPGKYWMGIPAGYMSREDPVEDRFPGVRLDWMILFDLRMWKKVRNDLRALYISTVVTIPEFKRILGIRFAGLYTTLAQLYLIADREPDHSIINISLQMLTTPSITAEIVERGNFLTNLMAILYTFLTTRQVGHPWEVNSNAVLAFDSGSVTNRRMYHFFQDLKYLFQSPHVQERLRHEDRYLMQFLDLVKLNQGICPNVRAVSEHVEYETDTWIGASLITREVNKLCRQISEAFRNPDKQDSYSVQKAIQLATKSVIVNSIGAERSRFGLAEIKDEIRFKTLIDFEFDSESAKYEVVKFVVEEQPISFHHALHYTWSWLIECGKFLDAGTLRNILSFTAQDLKGKPKSMGKKTWPKRDYNPEDYLMAAFDYPLRVCAWLAQMKAGMWVRNGLSLRHQSATYRGIIQRDVSHQRDIFLLQTALVVCDPSRVLASIIDRYGMEKWVKGFFEQKTVAQDDVQHLDVVEDMIHLLIVLLSDRTSLLCPEDEPNPLTVAMRRDITHVLCFKPLSFSEICSKLPDRFNENEDFHTVLHEMATFKPPEGISDVGTFELRPEYVEYVDPYNAHYNKNQREESEAAYRKLMAKKTGKKPEDVVYEPKLRSINYGLFTGLANFTTTGMFAQVIYYCLLFPLVAQRLTPTVPFTRVETFLQVVLHLVLIAIAEDRGDEDEMSEESLQSFVYIALTRSARSNFMSEAPESKSIVSMLELISKQESLKACHPKVALILKRMRQKRPHTFESALDRLGVPVDRIATASPSTNNADEERERKKKAALAKVRAQFQQQQKSFLANQGDIDWGDIEDEVEDDQLEHAHKNFWKYPSGTCILCQEDVDDRKLYGTFALFTQSNILRQTDLKDPDFVREVANTPCNLDRSAEDIRPFGVAHENRKMVEKVNSAGETILTERQVIGKGFPARLSRPGPVSIGCGHIMHYSCFETYYEATERRHNAQIARHQPEEMSRLEFVCPLCKALGNAFLPIIWKGKEESYPGILPETATPGPAGPFTEFLDHQMKSGSYVRGLDRPTDHTQRSFLEYLSSTVVGTSAEKRAQAMSDVWDMSTPRSVTSSSAATPFNDGFLTPGQSSSVSTEAASGMAKELTSVYKRLRDTFYTNGLNTVPKAEGNQLCSRETLALSLGFSISAVEIQQRGVEAQYSMTLLEKIPEQVLTQLRILAENVASYTTVGGLRNDGDNVMDTEFRTDSERQHCQLFIAQYFGQESDSAYRPSDSYLPLLSVDTFVFLCECAFGVGPAQDIDITHLIRLCYLAEIVKVIYHMSINIPDQIFRAAVADPYACDPSLQPFAKLCMDIHAIRVGLDDRPISPGVGFDQPALDNLQGFYSFVKKYALVFLRKCAILLHAHYGVDFNSHISPQPDADELDRLTEALRVPTFDAMCTAVSPEGAQVGWPSSTLQLVAGWIQHEVYSPEQPSKPPRSAQLSHPAIFELVGLPKDYGTLIEESTRRKCPTTGKDLSDAAICLFCGEIFCSQSVCCLKEEEVPSRNGSIKKKIGGSQQHMRKCQGNVAMVLNIRKCCVFSAHRMTGSWSNAPYIDKYGEVDVALRHGRPLTLSQKRYDAMLRNMWLGHGIPTFISRKLEADINTGGWETI